MHGVSGALVERDADPAASADRLAEAFEKIWSAIRQGTIAPADVRAKIAPYLVETQMTRLFERHRGLPGETLAAPACALSGAVGLRDDLLDQGGVKVERAVSREFVRARDAGRGVARIRQRLAERACQRAEIGARHDAAETAPFQNFQRPDAIGRNDPQAMRERLDDDIAQKYSERDAAAPEPAPADRRTRARGHSRRA